MFTTSTSNGVLRWFRGVFVVLGVCGLVFGVGGCESEEAVKERELRELQAQVPSYYLTPGDVGSGYKLDLYSYRRLGVGECLMSALPPVLNLSVEDSYISYRNEDTGRVVTCLGVENTVPRYQDIASRVERRYEEVCKDLWKPKVGDKRWRIVRSSPIEGLGHGAFGLQVTEWVTPFDVTLDYPPTPEQLESDGRIRRTSSVRAYGRIGNYVVTVFIDDKSQEPASVEELKRLWDMQVDKVLKLTDKGK